MNAWEQVLARIETKVNRHSFYTWFKPTSFLADGGGSISVRVPNPLFTNWLTKHYSVVISEALNEMHRPEVAVVFVSDDERRTPAAESPRTPTARRGRAGRTAADCDCRRKRAGDLTWGWRSHPPLYLRHLHRRTIESVRACGLPRCSRGAIPVIQSAVHLWRGWPRQDAPDACHRAIRPSAQPDV